jgi:hypothetical protein
LQSGIYLLSGRGFHVSVHQRIKIVLEGKSYRLELKTMKSSTVRLLPILFSILLAQCVTLLPEEQREKSWIEEGTKLTAEEAYDRANAHLTLTTKGADFSALRDRSAKRIIVNYVLRGCPAPGYLPTELDPDWHEFKLDFEAKDNRVRIRILDLRSWATEIMSDKKAPNIFGPRNAEQMQGTIDKCIYPRVVKPLIAAVRKSDDW